MSRVILAMFVDPSKWSDATKERKGGRTSDEECGYKLRRAMSGSRSCREDNRHEAGRRSPSEGAEMTNKCRMRVEHSNAHFNVEEPFTG